MINSIPTQNQANNEQVHVPTETIITVLGLARWHEIVSAEKIAQQSKEIETLKQQLVQLQKQQQDE